MSWQSSFPHRKNALYICLGPTSSKISLKVPFVRLRKLRDRTRLRKGFYLLSSDLKQHKDRFRSVALDRLERELTSFYDLPHRGESWSRQRQSFLEYLAGK